MKTSLEVVKYAWVDPATFQTYYRYRIIVDHVPLEAVLNESEGEKLVAALKVLTKDAVISEFRAEKVD